MKTRGFTLTELLIVLVIIAIIASLAWPAYRQQILKTRRSTGVSALIEMAARLEHYYIDHGSYTGATLGATNNDGYYHLTVVSQNDLTFLLSATPMAKGKQDKDKCGTFTLDSLGNRGLQGNTVAYQQCWK